RQFAIDACAQTQAVACILKNTNVGKLADRRLDDVEGLAGARGYFDLPALALSERFGVDMAVEQLHLTQMRDRVDDLREYEAAHDNGDEPVERRDARKTQRVPERRDADARKRPGDRGADEIKKAGHGVGNRRCVEVGAG